MEVCPYEPKRRSFESSRVVFRLGGAPDRQNAPPRQVLYQHAIAGVQLSEWRKEESTVDSPVYTIMVYNHYMATTKQVRRSVTLPPQVDRQIETIAKTRRLSGNRVLLELVELGLEAQKQKEKAFFELANRFRDSNDPEEVKRLGNELGRFIFGE